MWVNSFSRHLSGILARKTVKSVMILFSSPCGEKSGEKIENAECHRTQIDDCAE